MQHLNPQDGHRKDGMSGHDLPYPAEERDIPNAVNLGAPAVHEPEKPLSQSGIAAINNARHLVAKRSFDLLGSIALLIALSPLYLVIAVCVKLSGSPVVFSHRRIGQNGKPFNCYKFRSMVPNAEELLQEMLASDEEILREWRENHKLRNDPRITKVGRLLRKSSLDELPQLWNVVKGEMSLVGPRPVVSDEIARYGSKAHTYCSVKPGMTGLWQIMGRSNVTYSRRVSMDALYVKKQSLLLDIWILFKTLGVVVKRVGAH